MAFCLFHLCTPVNTMCHVSSEIGFICRSTPETQEIDGFLRSWWKKVTGWEGQPFFRKHRFPSGSLSKTAKTVAAINQGIGSISQGKKTHWAFRVCRLHRTLAKAPSE